MRFRVGFIFAAALATLCSSAAAADDIGAAARGVVRVIAGAQSYADPEDVSVSFGSGFAISPHRVVTNAHVVENAENPYADAVIAVVPSEGTHRLRGTVVAYDRSRDLAIVDVGSARLEPLAIYSGPIDSGEHAAALGYPGNVDIATATSLDDLINPTAPVRSEGNISDQRTVEGKPALLHTAAISRGNSGGPLVDGCGRVLGVNTYITITNSGDAPFAFAIVSQELMSFLREHGEQYQQVGSACVTMAEQAAREQRARESADRERAAAQQQAANEQQQRVDHAKAAAEDSRQNHAAAAALLAVLAVIAGALCSIFLVKDRAKPASASALIATLGLAGAGYTFISRPSLEGIVPKLTPPASAAAAPISGKLLCEVKSEFSRITVSSTADLAITWDVNGCMNGRTQYVQETASWRRVLVPNGSETVYVQDFDPLNGRYVSTRYLLPQTDMDRLRQIRRSSQAESCSSDPETIQQLQQLTDQLVGSLPPAPNEKLVYECHGAAG